MDLNLKNVYEEIASDFDKTRRIVWTGVKDFIDDQVKDTQGLEIGCGNGKNMLYRNDLVIEGVDFCEKFVEICKEKNLTVSQGDMRELLYDDNNFDFTLSVAVLHHLYSLEDRLKSIKEQIRVTKKDGQILIIVWALKQTNFYQKREFTKTDEMISWKKKDGKILYRYYHMYHEDELETEVKSFSNIKVIKSFYDRGNYGVILKKIE